MREASPHHVYVLVRQDLPLTAQLVQVGHACLEAGARFPQPAEQPCHLVVLSRDSEESLLQTVQKMEQEGVAMRLFFDPDPIPGGTERHGYTAACSAPIQGRERRLFRRLPLWKAG